MTGTTEYSISELPFTSVSKRVFMRNYSCENVFPLRVHLHANHAHFHMAAFARGHVLKKRPKRTRESPTFFFFFFSFMRKMFILMQNIFIVLAT